MNKIQEAFEKTYTGLDVSKHPEGDYKRKDTQRQIIKKR